MINILCFQILASTTHGKTSKSQIKQYIWVAKTKMRWRSWNVWWIILWTTILCIWYSRLFWVHGKKHEKPTENPRIQIYIKKIENIVTLELNERLEPVKKCALIRKYLVLVNFSFIIDTYQQKFKGFAWIDTK